MNSASYKMTTSQPKNKSDQNSDIDISLKDFLDYLATAYKVNEQLLDENSGDSKNNIRVDWNKLCSSSILEGLMAPTSAPQDRRQSNDKMGKGMCQYLHPDVNQNSSEKQSKQHPPLSRSNSEDCPRTTKSRRSSMKDLK